MLEWIGFLPLLGLTGNWRGYRMGGKAIGGASMSTDMKKKFEAARASGNMDQAKALADKAQKFNDDKKAEKAKAKEAKTIASVDVGLIVSRGEAEKDGFAKAEISIPIAGGKTTLINADIKGEWAIHQIKTPSGKNHTAITHYPSGLQLMNSGMDWSNMQSRYNIKKPSEARQLINDLIKLNPEMPKGMNGKQNMTEMNKISKMITADRAGSTPAPRI